MKLKAVLDSEVTTKLLVAVRCAAENLKAARHFHYAICMKTHTAAVAYNEELQLITFCDNRGMLKQELCTAQQMIPRPEMTPSENEKWYEVCFSCRDFNFFYLELTIPHRNNSDDKIVFWIDYHKSSAESLVIGYAYT